MTSPALALHVDAPDAATWVRSHLPRRFDGWVADDVRTDVVSMAEVLADDAAVLRAQHLRLVANGTPAPAAATYLAGWWAGIIAGAVGEALASAGAALVVDGVDAPTDVVFRVHPEGWTCGLELPARAVVAAGHPWSATRTATVSAEPGDVIERAVAGLVALTRPVIDACHGLARVGRAGLWNEVGDALGTALAHQRRIPVTPSMLAVLEAAVALPAAPWRARPDLVLVETPALGCVHVVRKGGCCLAYTASPGDGEGRYCSTCSFRSLEDATGRQLAWHADAT